MYGSSETVHGGLSVLQWILLGGGVVVGLSILLTLIFGTFFMIEQQTMGVIQRFGKFQRLQSPGLGLKIPFVDQIAARVSLQQQQLVVKVETKTKDNVFVQLPIAVQFEVISEKVRDAHYRLSNPANQMTSYVMDVVRAHVPKLTLDELFERKDEIAQSVKAELGQTMDDFGYRIVNALVVDVEPDAQVKQAMNHINAAQRNRIAANDQAEADKIRMVKAAEAEAESKILQGKGIAGQRAAIIEGLKKSVTEFKDAVGGDVDTDEVMHLVLLTQYFDTLKEMGQGGAKVIYVNHTPGGLNDITSQIQNGTMLGGEAVSAAPKPPVTTGAKAAA